MCSFLHLFGISSARAFERGLEVLLGLDEIEVRLVRIEEQIPGRRAAGFEVAREGHQGTDAGRSTEHRLEEEPFRVLDFFADLELLRSGEDRRAGHLREIEIVDPCAFAWGGASRSTSGAFLRLGRRGCGASDARTSATTQAARSRATS